MRIKQWSVLALGCGLAFVAAGPARAGSVEDRLEALEREIRDLRVLREADQMTIQELQERVATSELERGEIYTEIEDLSEEAMAESNFMLSGYGEFRFVDRDGGDDGADNGTFQLHHFNPIFHYRMGERLTWVSELEFELETEVEGEEAHNELELGLEYSYLDYVIHDWLTFRAGKFFTPLGVFHERLHPAWINKLPTRPLPYTAPTMLLPMTDVGIMAHGGFEVNPLFTYKLALTNGPGPMFNGAGTLTAIQPAGMFTDNNNNKTVSGRLGVIPYPGFDFGVSGMLGAYTNDGENDYEALVLDANVQLFENLLDIRAEYLDTTTERPGPLSDVDREGWYVQAAHRLAWLEQSWIQSLEPVIRSGEVESDLFGEDDRKNLAVGLNYYLMNNFVLRVAYDWYDGNTRGTRQDQFTAQLTYGF